MPLQAVKDPATDQNFRAIETRFPLGLKDLLRDVRESLVPVGTLLLSASAAAPDGYLLCEGQAVSRTTYAALFSAIGTTYGVGDGSTTFNVPDPRGRVPVGLGTHADVNALGDNDGEATVANRRPKHTHSVSGNTGTVSAEIGAAAGAFGVGINTHTHSVNLTSGVDGPDFLTVNVIIKT